MPEGRLFGFFYAVARRERRRHNGLSLGVDRLAKSGVERFGPIDMDMRSLDAPLVQTATGSPLSRHSGSPFSRRRALRPFARSSCTASKDIRQYGPRQ
jgi:hypothetical protein